MTSQTLGLLRNWLFNNFTDAPKIKKRRKEVEKK